MAHRILGRTAEGQALFRLVVEMTHAVFRLRAEGARFGAVTPWGGSTFGMLQTLAAMGPRTVPEIARMRPVARQHIQKLANEMAAEGLVEFVDNPAHKRSKLVRLTPAGEAAFDDLCGKMAAYADELAVGMDEDALRAAAETVHALRDRIGEG